MRKYILASSSPRRKALLKLLDITFESVSPNVDECLDQTLTLEEAIMKLAYEKAKDVYRHYPNDIVFGFDTLVCVDNHVLGKPKNDEDAMEMLRLLSGKTHRVITGCAILSEQSERVFYKDAVVKFSTITDQEIQDYIHTQEPFGKAGAYAIQGFGAKFIEYIQGDYYAIMGLPVHEVYKQLKGIVKT